MSETLDRQEKQRKNDLKGFKIEKKRRSIPLFCQVNCSLTQIVGNSVEIFEKFE